ncbi:MAG TPA: hypothetical protein VGA61_07900 [Anaerolineae bacterium]
MLAQKIGRMARAWLPLALATGLLAGLIYGVAQQVLRQDANDPQIQMAEDTAALLAQGQQPAPAAPVDIATSLAPYLIVFDGQGRPVAGSARLHGNLPSVPEGVLDAARQRGENRVTWQPEPGVRSATVIVPVRGAGYVLAGRSLREVEQRTDNLLLLAVAGALAILAATLVAVVAVNLI